jgi:hypothetical protein
MNKIKHWIQTIPPPPETFQRFLRKLVPAIPVLFLCAFLASFTAALARDSSRILRAHQDAFTLKVYARTDLGAGAYAELEQVLRGLDHVSSLEAVSPENALKMLEADPNPPVNPTWVAERQKELKGKDTVLPWSYELSLEKWDAGTLDVLVNNIRAIPDKGSKGFAVDSVRYDEGRLGLLLEWRQQVRSLKMALRLFFFILSFSFGAAFLSYFKKHAWKPRLHFSKEFFFSVGLCAALGLLAGGVIHGAGKLLFPALFAGKRLFAFESGAGFILLVFAYSLFEMRAHAKIHSHPAE